VSEEFIFEDKRISVMVLMLWLVTVNGILYEVGIFNSKFMRFGPSPDTMFMSTPIDTWYRYSLVALFTFLNTSVNDFLGDSLSPFILNIIADPKTRYIPYPKYICVLLNQLWSVYVNVMGVLSLFLSLTQADFIVIRTAADLCVSMYTNYKFLQNKEYNEGKYRELEMLNVVQDQPDSPK
jgi:hypothetical protein